MILKTQQEYEHAKAQLLAQVAGRFEPPAGYADVYNELNEELKQCPVDVKKEP